ncbi:MAG TPA: energy transducer TonB, partial [Enterobacteriaceae bacterium]|nr:energy transducer TonB [Enterobacteriaceae bacterium]
VGEPVTEQKKQPPEHAAPETDTKSSPRRDLRRLVKPGLAVVAVGVVAWMLWQWISAPSSVQRKPPEMTMIVPLPPPPPPEPKPEPPPEPEEPPPEPEMVEPEPTPVEEPTPAEEPEPEEPKVADAADPMQMNADTQAGSDAFNIGAGSGRGMSGSGGGGVGNATYGQYLGYALQKLVREDDSTGYLAYQLDVDIWIDRDGRVTRAEIRRSSGDSEIDGKVSTVLRSAVLSQRPTPSTTMPVKIRLNSRRPS